MTTQESKPTEPPAPQTDPAAEAQAGRLQSDKDVWERIMARSREREAPEPAAPAPEAKEAAPKKSTPEPKPASGDVSKGSGPNPEDVERARNFLTLKVKVPKDVLDSRKPEDLVAWREELLEREANISRTFSEHSQYKARLEELEGKEAAAASEQTNGLPADDVDLGAYAKAYVEKMGFDEDAAPEFEKALRAIYEPLNARLKNAEQKLGAQGKTQFEEMVTDVKAALVESFPSLAEEDVWNRVFATADEMAAMPRYQKGGNAKKALRTLLEDAAKLEGLAARNGSASSEDKEAERKEQREAKESAQTIPSNGKAVEPAQMTEKERDAAYYKALVANRHLPKRDRIARAQRAAGIT